MFSLRVITNKISGLFFNLNLLSPSKTIKQLTNPLLGHLQQATLELYTQQAAPQSQGAGSAVWV